MASHTSIIKWLKNKKSVPNVAKSEVGHFLYNIVVYYVYIIQLKDKTYYHGYSHNLKERLLIHEKGLVSSTRNLRPIKLVFYASFISKTKALEFEKYLKTQSGYAFRNKRLIAK